MLEVKNNVIKITKGDSGAIRVDLTNVNDEPYTMASGDKLILTIRKIIGGPILLSVESTTNVLDLLPEDTKKLEVGACVFDVQLVTEAGDVFTVIGLKDKVSSNMIVYPEVTEVV